MKKPVLVIMAAGMGSRYGGLKRIDGPFAVINADDYYGSEAFQMIYHTLQESKTAYSYAMVGYVLANTLTENGSVARGVCNVDAEGYLQQIEEKTKIEKRGEGAAYSDDNGETWKDISPESTVSMNLWGFQSSIMNELEGAFVRFLEEEVPYNPLKCEFFLPTVVQQLLKTRKAKVKVLRTEDKWFGVTYKEDKDKVMEGIKRLKQRGVYPQELWENSHCSNRKDGAT